MTPLPRGRLAAFHKRSVTKTHTHTYRQHSRLQKRTSSKHYSKSLFCLAGNKFCLSRKDEYFGFVLNSLVSVIMELPVVKRFSAPFQTTTGFHSCLLRGKADGALI